MSNTKKEKVSYIYKLISPDTDKCYIGSAHNLNGRLSLHMKDYQRYQETGKSNNDCFTKSVEIMKYRDVAIIELERLVGASKRTTLERESYYINTHPNAVNANVPIKEGKEYEECVCGGVFRKTRNGVRQHVNGNQHKQKMSKRGLMIPSIDGKNKVDFSKYKNNGTKASEPAKPKFEMMPCACGQSFRKTMNSAKFHVASGKHINSMNFKGLNPKSIDGFNDVKHQSSLFD